MRDRISRLASYAVFVLAVLSIALVTACGSSAAVSSGGAGSTPGAATGRLHVIATVGPTCPVQRAGAPPCIAPYQGGLDITASDGRALHVTTSADGIADIDLPAGTYLVSAPPGGLPRLTQPVSVTVTTGSTTSANVEFDTGIR